MNDCLKLPGVSPIPDSTGLCAKYPGLGSIITRLMPLLFSECFCGEDTILCFQEEIPIKRNPQKRKLRTQLLVLFLCLLHSGLPKPLALSST